jgi:hypothetical protein
MEDMHFGVQRRFGSMEGRRWRMDEMGPMWGLVLESREMMGIGLQMEVCL